MQEQGIQSVLTMDDHFIQVGMGFLKVLQQKSF
jgi:predicted nucleic acid-binding protein